MDGSVSALLQQVRRGEVSPVRDILDATPSLLNGACDHEGSTPLMWAARLGHLSVMELLLDRGVTLSVDERDCCGRTAIYWASWQGRASVIELLLERGADPTIPASNYGNTPLMAASLEGHCEALRSLLRHPRVLATINAQNDNKKTALWRASAFGHVGAVKALLDAGADFLVADHQGWTPRAVARGERQKAPARLLEVSRQVWLYDDDVGARRLLRKPAF
jgi:uncharacterized protein